MTSNTRRSLWSRTLLILAGCMLSRLCFAAATPEEAIGEAERLEKTGNSQAATRIYQDFLATYPTHSQALEVRYRAGRCLEDLGQVDEAIIRYSEVVKAGGTYRNRPEAMVRLGKLLAANKDYPGAIAIYEQLLAQGAGIYEDEALNHCAGWYAMSERFNDAAAKFNILKRKTGSPLAEQAASKLAMLWLRAGKMDLAIDAVQDLARGWPKNKQIPGLLLKVADAFRVQKRYDNVVATCAQLRSAYPDDDATVAASYLLGVCHRERKEFAEAVKVLDPLGKLTQPRLRGIAAEALVLSAEIHRQDLKDVDQAIARYEQVPALLRDSEIDRKNALLEQAYFNLGEHWFGRKNYAAALENYLQLRALGTQINILGRVIACQAALNQTKSAEAISDTDIDVLKTKITENPRTDIAAEAQIFILDRKLANTVRLKGDVAALARDYEQMLTDYPAEVLAKDRLECYLQAQIGYCRAQSPDQALWPQAVAAYAKAVALDPTPGNPYRITALEAQAELAERMGDLATARKHYGELLAIQRQVVKESKSDAKAEARADDYLKAWITRAGSGDSVKEAIASTEALIAEAGPLSREGRSARFYLGELHYLKKDFSAAAKTWREFIKTYGPKQDDNGDVAGGPWTPGKVDAEVEQVHEAAARVAQAWYLQGHQQNMILAYRWIVKNFPAKNKWIAEAQYWLAMELGKGKDAESKDAKRAQAEALWTGVVCSSLDVESISKNLLPWAKSNDPEVQKYVKSALIKAGQLFSESDRHELAAGAFSTYLTLFPEQKRGRDGPPKPDDDLLVIARYALGLEYLALNDLTKLITAYQPYLDNQREDRFRPSALKLLGFHAGKSEQYQVGVDAYATLLDEYGEPNPLDPKSGKPVPVPGDQRLRKGRTSWNGIRQPPTKDIDLAEIRWLMGYLFWKHDEFALCAQALAPFIADPGLAKSKNRDKALYMAGQSWYRLGDYVKGITAIQALVRGYPRFEAIEEAYTYAARGYLETKAWTDFDLVMKTFLADFAGSDRRPRMDYYVALAQVGRGQVDKGAASLRAIADSDIYQDVKADAAYQYALILRQAKPPKEAEALVYLERSVAAYPLDVACLEGGRCAIALKQWAKASELLGRAVRDFPKARADLVGQAKTLLVSVKKELAKKDAK